MAKNKVCRKSCYGRMNEQSETFPSEALSVFDISCHHLEVSLLVMVNPGGQSNLLLRLFCSMSFACLTPTLLSKNIDINKTNTNQTLEAACEQNWPVLSYCATSFEFDYPEVGSSEYVIIFFLFIIGIGCLYLSTI